MTDYFHLLGIERRPWLEPEVVQAQFLAFSAEAHPDRSSSAATRPAAQERFTALNAAYACLRNPKERLRHLLELERGAPLPQLERVTSEASDQFFEIGRVCQQADKFLSERAKLTSPLMRARLYEQALEWSDTLSRIRDGLQERATKLETQISSLNTSWETAPPLGSAERLQRLPLADLEQLYRQYSFVGRWLDQVRERIVQLVT